MKRDKPTQEQFLKELGKTREDFPPDDYNMEYAGIQGDLKLSKHRDSDFYNLYLLL